MRSFGVQCALYIDDRHVGRLRLPLRPLSSSFSAFQLAEMAAYIACFTSISLGYFIALSKSSLLPATALPFLGNVCDSVRQAFLLPPDKRAKFSALRESILEHKTVSLKNLQKFAGKTTSFASLVPAAKLYTHSVFQAISHASSSLQLRVTPELRKELLHWRFLDSWKGCLPWKSECHIQLRMYSDASHSGWGGCLVIPGQSPSEACGLRDVESRALPIAVKEPLALLRALESLAGRIHNARIDAFVDNKVLLASWKNQLSRSQAISDVLKSLFESSYARNLHLSLVYVPSKENPADGPSRVVSDFDYILSPVTWQRVDSTFGPHTLDLMASPGRLSRFFSPLQAAGTNVFAQNIPPDENAFFSRLLC